MCTDVINIDMIIRCPYPSRDIATVYRLGFMYTMYGFLVNTELSQQGYLDVYMLKCGVRFRVGSDVCRPIDMHLFFLHFMFYKRKI